MITVTTRSPREGERDGKNYHFISPDEFTARRERGEFLEWAVVHGATYGTPAQSVREILGPGRSAVLVVDVQGAANIKKNMREALFIFVAPPSLKELERRLRRRRTETDESVQARLAAAAEEMSHTNWYDNVIINRDATHAAVELKRIIQKELESTGRSIVG